MNDTSDTTTGNSPAIEGETLTITGAVSGVTEPLQGFGQRIVPDAVRVTYANTDGHWELQHVMVGGPAVLKSGRTGRARGDVPYAPESDMPAWLRRWTQQAAPQAGSTEVKL